MSASRRPGHDGAGPGAITPDGCAVRMYARLPAGPEPDLLAAALRPGATVLELGCGAGRITHPLLARGFAVTAVDESAEMLAEVRGAATVCSPIEDLELAERFDAVLLASRLVHTADPAVRRGMLAACRRHVRPGGRVLIQRETHDVYDRVPRETVHGELTVRLLSVEHAGPGLRAVRVEYLWPDARWTQSFVTRSLSDGEFTAALAEADLTVDEHLTEDGTWVAARPGAAGDRPAR